MRSWRLSRGPVFMLMASMTMLLLVSCGGDGNKKDQSSATEVTTTLKEFAIDLTAQSATAGEVKFKLVNSGALPHEFKVIKSDIAPDKLPLDGPKVDEGKVDVSKKTDLAAGESRDVTFDLSSGRYVLICNVEGHYQAGMHAAFSVQ